MRSTRLSPPLLALTLVTAACAAPSRSSESGPPLPDLVVESIEVRSIQRVGASHVLDLEVVVANRGDAETNLRRFWMAAELENAAFGATGSTVEASASIGALDGPLVFAAKGKLAPGQTLKVSSEVWVQTPWPGQEHRLLVEADAEIGAFLSRIRESDETNNVGSTTLRLE